MFAWYLFRALPVADANVSICFFFSNLKTASVKTRSENIIIIKRNSSGENRAMQLNKRGPQWTTRDTGTVYINPIV